LYYYGSKKNTQEIVVSVTPSATSGMSEESKKISSAFYGITNITLDTSIFNDPTFDSLVDFSITLPEPEKGKTNPFSPSF